MSEYKMYIANLAKYNEGILQGNWINFPIDEDDLKEEISQILGEDEEWAIHDYELPFKVDEYDNVFDVNNLIQFMLDEDINENVLSYLLDYNSYDYADIDGIREAYNNSIIFYDVSNAFDLGYALIHELSMLEIPENIEPYFNYESYGNDSICNGFVLIDGDIAIETY